MNDNDRLKKVYTIDGVAEFLQLTKPTIYKYLRNGKLKGCKIGKEWRITTDQISEFLEQCKQK